MRKEDMTPQDVTDLCSEAVKHWKCASGRTKVVKFTWRGSKYKSTLTSFRILVHTSKGEPVAMRWGGPDD